ncbi:MAG: DbpA RNA binding domain-containing protein [Gemmatimonadales bacterium]
MRPVVLVIPPAVECAGKAWELIDSHAVLVCTDHAQATLWADAAPPELRPHAVTSLARSTALLKEGRSGMLAGSAADLAALIARSVLKLGDITTIVLAWPESFAADPALDTLLAEAPEARRVVLSWNPPSLTEFLERHARRPEIQGDIPLDDVGRPLGPAASARYAIVAHPRHRVRDVIDTLRASRPYVWTGGPIAAPGEAPDAVIAAVLPTRDELRMLAAIAPVTVPVLATQLPYLRSIAALTPLALPSSADRAQDRSGALRAEITARLAQGDVDAELAVLAPLFEEHDPALVAAALLAIGRQPVTPGQPVAPAPPAGWARVFVTVGTKDRASAKDLVGALIKEVGLQKGQIGKIDVRETFSLIEVAAAEVDQAVRRLSGVSIRGRRITARPDRG